MGFRAISITKLTDIADVDTPTTDTDVPTWDSATSRWVQTVKAGAATADDAIKYALILGGN